MIDVEVEIRLLAEAVPVPTPVEEVMRRGARLRTRRRLVVAVSLATAAVVATVGLASSSTPSAGWPTPEAPIFDGLPHAVVVEVLSNPKAQDNVRILTPVAPEDRDSMWQGMVENFVQCRQLLAVYETWKVTGRPGMFPPTVVATHPLQDSYGAIQVADRFYRAEIATGDIAHLRADLLNESGCGVWIPATPGNSSGPTIADVVRSLG